MRNNKSEILLYIDNAAAVLLGILFFFTPLLFTSQFTDYFALPKQILLAVVVSLSIVFLAVRMVMQAKVHLRSTPFDLPIFLFTLAAFLSAIFAVNRYDSLINFIPLLFATLLYFVIVNLVKKENTILMMIIALVAGSGLSGIISLLSYFKIYIFPYQYTQSQSFSTFGALLDQAMYLALILPFAAYIAWPFITKMLSGRRQTNIESESVGENNKNLMVFGIGFSLAAVLIIAGLGISLVQLLTIAKPIILPIQTGFQTGFATISQDPGRTLQSLLFGSGYGTYLTDFTRFKQAAYNLNPTLWSFTFFRSSTYLLELLATTGLFGLLSFLFIAYRFIRERTLFLPLALAFIAAVFLPFSFTIQVLFFVILGVFAATQALHNPKAYEDLEFYFVAMRKGLITAVPESEADRVHNTNISSGTYARILPFIAAIIMLGFVGMIDYMTGRYILSDMALQQSLVAASQNNGLATYNFQRQAIALFPYRDTNYRIFSQTNLALANSLAVSQPTGQQPSQQTQQTILTLIQQSINAARNAVTISPQTALNWNNLSNIYRSLIGFGQNADQFAVVTNQEAIRLDPANPQQYINLGGIYYQLGAWDNALAQFNAAVQMKPDFANAYYNLGHAFEGKGDLANALIQYQAVSRLVQNDQPSLKRITDEINVLQEKIGKQQASASNVTGTAQNQPAIDVNKAESQLPEKKPQTKIEGPSITPTEKPSTTPSPTGVESVSPTPNL